MAVSVTSEVRITVGENEFVVVHRNGEFLTIAADRGDGPGWTWDVEWGELPERVQQLARIQLDAREVPQ